MSRTVVIFKARGVTGYSEPGTCPRCARSVNVGSRGGPKAHKCPHGVQCSRTLAKGRSWCGTCDDARRLPAAEKRCCDAAVALHMADVVYDAAKATGIEPMGRVIAVEARIDAIAEATAAGAELARLRGGT